MQCDSCGNELVFVGFYDADGSMAEFYCDHCVKRKITRIQTQYFTPKKA